MKITLCRLCYGKYRFYLRKSWGFNSKSHVAPEPTPNRVFGALYKARNPQSTTLKGALGALRFAPSAILASQTSNPRPQNVAASTLDASAIFSKISQKQTKHFKISKIVNKFCQIPRFEQVSRYSPEMKGQVSGRVPNRVLLLNVFEQLKGVLVHTLRCKA